MYAKCMYFYVFYTSAYLLFIPFTNRLPETRLKNKQLAGINQAHLHVGHKQTGLFMFLCKHE